MLAWYGKSASEENKSAVIFARRAGNSATVNLFLDEPPAAEIAQSVSRLTTVVLEEEVKPAAYGDLELFVPTDSLSRCFRSG